MNAIHYCGYFGTTKRQYGKKGGFLAIVCPWVISLNGRIHWRIIRMRLDQVSLIFGWVPEVQQSRRGFVVNFVSFKNPHNVRAGYT